MFAYCGNAPVNCVDPTGLFWKELGKTISKAWNSIKTFAKNTFGAGSSSTVTIMSSQSTTPEYLPIVVETGTNTTQTVSAHGDSSKPISVYTNKNLTHPIQSSSAGININIANFTLDLGAGLDDIGISGSLVEKKTTSNLGLRLNLSKFKIGVEWSTAIQQDNRTETAYTNISVNGWTIIAVYLLLATGQTAPSPSYLY